MGISASSPARRYKTLIGDLEEDISSVEHKMYSLSQYVLDQNSDMLGKHRPELDMCIIDTWSAKNVHEEDNGSKKNDRADEKFTLFQLMISEKPYFCSQTFTQWNTIYKFDQWWTPCCKKGTKIYIQPVESFPQFLTDFEIDLKHLGGSHDFFALLKRLLEAYFDGMTIDILPNVNFHDSKWKIKTRFHHKTNSKQYHVTDFFPKLRSVKPADGYCILGLSWTDLYPTEKLNFVLGEAHFAFKSAIFCFGRCEPKIYDPETFKDIDEMDAKLLWRIIKVVSHETCHLFGLMHCWYFRCNMNESCSMAEAASQPLFLCPVCLRKLQHACGFDLINRYRRILVILQDIVSVFPSQEIEQSIQWLEKCLKFLLTDKL